MRAPWRGLLALLVAFLPAAAACSPPPQSSTPFDPLEWRGTGDHLVANVDGATWATYDLAADQLTYGRASYRSTPSGGPPARAQDEASGLALQPFAQGMACNANAQGTTTCTYPSSPPINSCTGHPSYTFVGVQLVRGEQELRRWGGPGQFQWQGTIWSSPGHGHVWEHGTSTLHSVRWSDGSVASTVLDGSAALPPSLWSQPHTRPDGAAVLPGPGAVVILDPVARTATTLRSEVDAYPLLEGSTAFFLRAHQGQVAMELLDVVNGSSLWRHEGPGSVAARTPFGAVVWDMAADAVRMVVEGEVSGQLAVGAGDLLISPGRNGTAIGIRGESPRLVVLDRAGAVVLDEVLRPPHGNSGTHTPVPTRPTPTATAETGQEQAPRSSPLAPALLALGLAALGAHAVRRRLG